MSRDFIVNIDEMEKFFCMSLHAILTGIHIESIRDFVLSDQDNVTPKKRLLTEFGRAGITPLRGTRHEDAVCRVNFKVDVHAPRKSDGGCSPDRPPSAGHPPGRNHIIG